MNDIKHDCLSGDTLVLLADGCPRKISDIRIGDLVLSPTTNRMVHVVNVWRGMENQMYEITAGEYKLTATADHPILTDSGWVRAGKLKIGDLVQTQSSYIPIANIVLLDRYVEVYNIDLDGNTDECSFLANEIVVGDMQIQNRIN